MMKLNLLISIILLGLCSISCKKNTTSKQENHSEVVSEVDPLTKFKRALYQTQIDSVFKKYDFNGIVGVYSDSTLVYKRSNGFEDFKTKKKISDSTVFAIASISKQFTTAMIMKLAEEGKLKPTDSVFHYLSEFQNGNFKNVTIEQLMNHTSGVVDHGDGIASKPGSEFSYSNKGFYFLGKIIEKASGQSFDDYATTFFKENGLRHTYTANTFKGGHFAGAHLGSNNKNSAIENMPKRLADKSISTAAGGILTTIGDLHLWNQKLYSGKIITKESLEKLTSKSADRNHPIFGKMGYGYGLMMSTTPPKVIFHSGYVKGAPSLNVYYPETKTSLIILSNIADESKGKNTIFQPHREIKKIASSIENAMVVSNSSN